MLWLHWRAKTEKKKNIKTQQCLNTTDRDKLITFLLNIIQLKHKWILIPFFFNSLRRLVRLDLASKWVNNTSDLVLLTSWARPGLGMPHLALYWKALHLFCKSRASFLTDLRVRVPQGKRAAQGSIVHKEAEPPTQCFLTWFAIYQQSHSLSSLTSAETGSGQFLDGL